jgi:hypothetical protein
MQLRCWNICEMRNKNGSGYFNMVFIIQGGGFGRVKIDTEIIIGTEGNSVRNALDKTAITDCVAGEKF